MKCRVYWGSHGCQLERGHEGSHLCDCANISAEEGGVGKPPYYGPDTHFYGEDVVPERDRWAYLYRPDLL